MKMAVFWVVAPCSLVDLVNFYQTTRRYNDSHLRVSYSLKGIFSPLNSGCVLEYGKYGRCNYRNCK
jgi:hypothetical protein